MAMDLSTKALSDLRRMIENGERSGRTADPLFLAVLEEVERRGRRGGALDMGRTRALVEAAARQDRFLAYGDVAAASDLAWSMSVRSRVTEHLAELCMIARREDAPMLSAIVVRAEDVRTGELTAGALDGFIRCAVALGLDADGTPEKRRRFVRAEQRKVFTWAKRGMA